MPTDSSEKYKVVHERRTNCTAYVSEKARWGWLEVTLDNEVNQTRRHLLPSYLKVHHEKTLFYVEVKGSKEVSDKIEDIFIIREGWLRGQRACCKWENNKTSYIVLREPPHTGPALVRFDRNNNQLWYGGVGPVDAFAFREIPEPRRYGLRIPAYPHATSAEYGKYGTTWFSLGSKKRFLHTGTQSSGCIAVTDHDAWNKRIYHYLIKARRNNRSVGTLTVFAGHVRKSGDRSDVLSSGSSMTDLFPASTVGDLFPESSTTERQLYRNLVGDFRLPARHRY